MLIENIGLPAFYEQLAEECTELAQASLKYARFLRGENPTPKSEKEIKDNLSEEIADVEICINELKFYDTESWSQSLKWTGFKKSRIKERFNLNKVDNDGTSGGY